MCFKRLAVCALFIQRYWQLPCWQQAQRGAFSPFMFGLLTASAVFSVSSMYMIRKELEDWELRKAERMALEADDLAKATEFAILTETADTYDSEATLRRIRQFSALATGETRLGDDATLVAEQGRTAFGQTGERIAFSLSDDPLAAAAMQQAADFGNLGTHTQTSLDTSAVRERQVQTSVNNLNQMAEQLYQFYSGQLRFPSPGEYLSLQKRLKIRDAWGNDFIYTQMNNDEATLEFVTPWNYTHLVKVSLD